MKFTDVDVAQRKEHWANRLPQLLENVDRRPYWQFRVVGAMHDPPACKALDGRIERYDSAFWAQHNPAKCLRRECRCTIRAYGLRDLEELGVKPPL